MANSFKAFYTENVTPHTDLAFLHSEIHDQLEFSKVPLLVGSSSLFENMLLLLTIVPDRCSKACWMSTYSLRSRTCSR